MVGDVADDARRLIAVTELSFWAGISQLRAGERLGRAQHAIENVIDHHDMFVIEKYVGHGIGRKLHEAPQIPNYGEPHEGPRLKEGMVFAIEPMVGLTTQETVELGDKWTVVMADGGLSAHYEHTVAITADGPEILTWPKELAEPAIERGARWLEERWTEGAKGPENG
jgi:methionyl aminopeptidase